MIKPSASRIRVIDRSNRLSRKRNQPPIKDAAVLPTAIPTAATGGTGVK
jgi:hypothetical protein